MNEPKDLLEDVCALSQEICSIARKAKKGNSSLQGSSFYGTKFHRTVVKLCAIEPRVITLLSSASVQNQYIQEFTRLLATLQEQRISPGDRFAAFRELDILVRSRLQPAFDAPPPDPTTILEPVLPSAVVKGTRGYLQKLALQANACYEARCFDACSVMLRKLVEVLLIEVYEAKNKQASIQNAAGEYFMLGEIISRALAEGSWAFGRETRRALPDIKLLGDRAAHNRRFVATKTDVDKLLGGVRATVDDLLHLAGLK